MCAMAPTTDQKGAYATKKGLVERWPRGWWGPASPERAHYRLSDSRSIVPGGWRAVALWGEGAGSLRRGVAPEDTGKELAARRAWISNRHGAPWVTLRIGAFTAAMPSLSSIPAHLVAY